MSVVRRGPEVEFSMTLFVQGFISLGLSHYTMNLNQFTHLSMLLIHSKSRSGVNRSLFLHVDGGNHYHEHTKVHLVVAIEYSLYIHML